MSSNKRIIIHASSGPLIFSYQPSHAYSTVLSCLDSISQNVTPLCYRRSCYHGSCGSCGMVVNGQKKLACLTFIRDIELNEIHLSPLPAFDQLIDLVVDSPSIFTDFPTNAHYIRKEQNKTERLENCIECGLCNSACPVQKPFHGPAALAAIHREIINNPKRSEEMKKLAREKRGFAACERHFACSRVCPASVYPGRAIEELRKMES